MAILETYGPHGQGMPVMLDDRDEVVIGSKAGCALVIDGDPAVSRVHARLERYVSVWSVTDCNSKNGTFVNDTRITHERRLENGDAITMGNHTKLVFRDAKQDKDTATAPAAPKPKLTPTEHDVLKELMRPWFQGGPFAPVARVDEIAKRRFTGEGAVKNCLANLYDKFDVPPMDPGNAADRKTRLAQRAWQAGVIGVQEYAGDAPE
jgi:pSer/pThr/pTyr-binding forkhead associated (FHA) protein